MCLNIVSDSIRLDLFVLNNNKLQNPTLVSIRAHWAFCVKRTCMWCRVPPPPPAHPVISAVVLFFSTISPFARWMGRGRSWLHFVTEEGTLVNETGTLKQTSCKWDQPFSFSAWWWSRAPSLVSFRFWQQAAKKEKRRRVSISTREARQVHTHKKE